MNKIEVLKKVTGIKRANCSTCKHLKHESDGDFGEFKWVECSKFHNYSNLKSFPFKKEMSCWEPGFWSSKFWEPAGTHYDHKEASVKFKEVVKAVKEVSNEG